jgi:hypothetical protein
MPAMANHIITTQKTQCYWVLAQERDLAQKESYRREEDMVE